MSRENPTNRAGRIVEDPLLRVLRGELELQVIGEAPVVLGVSGGPDSVALLSAWRMLNEDRPQRLVIAHFDHQLRANSTADAKFVAQLVERHGLEFHLGHAGTRMASLATSTVATGIEERARYQRYRFLAQVARKVGARWVATAHTADDQVETILFTILRGTGMGGLGGMPRCRPLGSGVFLLRPFLGVSRPQIEQFMARHGLQAILDPSNTDRAFTRNWIRHELLPMLRSRLNPRLDAALLRLSEQARDTQAMLEPLIVPLFAAVLERSPTRIVLDAQRLAPIEPVLLGAFFRRLFAEQKWPRKHWSRRGFLRLVDWLRDPRAKPIDLPGGVRAIRGRESIALIRSAKPGGPGED